MRITALRAIEYPESDGKPMAETPIHMCVLWDSIQTLIDWYADDPKVYVWGNMFLYYVQGDANKAIAPDLMVVKGVDKFKVRRVFKTWEEKRKPSVVLEVTSRKTKKEDLGAKLERYRDELRVPEYFLFDPFGEYIKEKLRGFRLRAGDYLPIKERAGRLPSKVLGLHLEASGSELRFWNPETSSWLLTPAEKTALLEDKSERDDAEIDRLRREIEVLKQAKKNGGL